MTVLEELSCASISACFYWETEEDRKNLAEPAKAVFFAARYQFGPENVKYVSKSAVGLEDFPVRMKGGDSKSFAAVSDSFSNLAQAVGSRSARVYVDPDLADDATDWLRRDRERLLRFASVVEAEQEEW
jgi:hypothetical protein